MSSLVESFYLAANLLHIVNLSCDANPSVLFPGVKFRLAIFFYQSLPEKKISKAANIFVTRYIRWYSEARATLFDNIEFTRVASLINGSIPKLASPLHRDLVSHLVSITGPNITSHRGRYKTYYHNAPVNWIRAQAFVPYFMSERDGQKVSTQLVPLEFETHDISVAAAATLCSSLFFIWWLTSSDCYHLNAREVRSFPVNLVGTQLAKALAPISKRLMVDMQDKSKRRVYNYRTSGRVEYDEFYLKLSKNIIDEVDTVLAQYFDLDPHELDYIINYDIKYRMGDELFEDSDRETN